MKTHTSSVEHLRHLIHEVGQPTNYFQGLLCQQSLAPDNLIFFRRGEHIPASAEGVSKNYHHRFELVFVLDQSGPVRIENTSFMLQPGEAALIFPNQFHHYINVDSGASDWLFVTFDLRSAEAIQALRNAPRVLDHVALELLQHVLREALHPSETGVDTLSVSFHLSRLLLHLRECVELPGDRRDIHSSESARDVILEKINRYIREHLNQSVTIPDISTELGYSVSHLRAVFRDRLGVSLGRYMRESRLSEAAQFLQNSGFNVSEIGERCGFESLYAFSRAFRKAYGIPPRAYRQLVVDGRAVPGRRPRGARTSPSSVS